ncbi:hypothetical protein [Microvirga arsenatis]|uniref:hypothetical protein n=1 Tax=Microvirga arsenatis TaxID=2692265 RepID=UPI001AED7D47|nr:hypothetical protein [Microvirga arsenatis]NBJ09805.1 hypothetical protein [Microvirga arsenatis]
MLITLQSCASENNADLSGNRPIIEDSVYGSTAGDCYFIETELIECRHHAAIGDPVGSFRDGYSALPSLNDPSMANCNLIQTPGNSNTCDV